MAAQAEAVLSGASQAAEPPADLAQAAAARGETVDLFEYLDSLPEVEDPFPPSEPDPEPAPEPERKPAEMLAEYIRERTKSAVLTPRKALAQEEPHLDEMLENPAKISALLRATRTNIFTPMNIWLITMQESPCLYWKKICP